MKGSSKFFLPGLAGICLGHSYLSVIFAETKIDETEKKMKAKWFIAAASLLALFACEQKQLPENPKDKEEYVDEHQNRWIWDAMLMRWMIMSPMGMTHFYYPQQGTWFNSANQPVAAPADLKQTVRSATPTSAQKGVQKSVFGKRSGSYSFGS